MLIWACFLGILYHITISVAEYPVPVMLWGGSVPTKTNDNGVKPHIVTDENEFSQILTNKIEDNIQPPILIFVTDNLCTPHIHQYKQVLEKLIDPNFLTYLPNVKRPMTVFENLPSYNHSNNKEINFISNGEIATLPISDVEDIPEIYKSLENKSNLLVGLSGRKCYFKSIKRVSRAIREDDNSTELQVITDRVILWSNQAPLIKYPDSDGFKPLQVPPAEASVRGSGTVKDPLILHIRFLPKDVLEFHFIPQSGSYWSLTNVVFMPDSVKKNYSTLNPIPNIVFPFNFSYHCAQKSVFSNANATLNISELQIQIDAKSFGEVYDCIGFTSIPIWTGVFVTFILGLIMIWGLIMIIDIRTMDRFDDPKGKTITISASE